NIEKANKHFKKAFSIDFKSLMDKKTWDDLIDIVNLRNMMVHNNGRVDEHFKTTVSYQRLKNNVNGDLYHLDGHTVMTYFESVVNAVTTVVNAYYEKYLIYRHVAIANYYFNYTNSKKFDQIKTHDKSVTPNKED
ncbi:MAG: hypothetical protein K2J80_13480, partial [Oscillospiraceae bacterium]|nr:hypothetical protein [Oscillospiraceae bacterium]